MSHPPQPVSSVLATIGNTPVVQLGRIVPDGSAQVFVKLETFNPTGSHKDRMAKAMIEGAEHRGDLRPGMTVVEATGGSTGSSLAMVCASLGYSFHALSSNAYAKEKLQTMAAFGASVHITHSTSGKATPDLMNSMKSRAAALGGTHDYFYTDQFSNRDALAGCSAIGHELLAQFPDGFDVFCSAFGTAALAMGVSRTVKSQHPAVHVALLEPDGAALLAHGQSGSHAVDGITPGFISEHVSKELYDSVRTISEEDARDTCRRLAREEGILVGTSSGLNVAAALQFAKELGPGKTVVTVACDTGLKYLSGTLYAEV